jgi:erythromycin esterase
MVTWMNTNCLPFQTSKPESGFDDLNYLKNLVGSARVVSLGEATHGTKEFFEMKHRILEYLVTQMGFNVFAMEADWAPSNLIDNYVQTGQGDPAALLRGLHYWMWNTQEVLNLIQWMQRHNQSPGNTPVVSFSGFDLANAHMAIDNVVNYLQLVDASAAKWADSLYAVYRPYQDTSAYYSQATSSVKLTCQANVRSVYDFLAARQSQYQARTSPKDFSRALHAALIVVQTEDAYSLRSTSRSRDEYMADNAQWILSNAGPNAKIVLWAHNMHVSTQGDANNGNMGGVLRSVYGSGMVVFGFDFYSGSFNAIASYNALGPAWTFSTVYPPRNSYEYVFHAANIPRFFLDVRSAPSPNSGGSWIAGPLHFRNIGGLYNDSYPNDAYYPTFHLPSMFDVLIYFDNTTASTLLQ